VEGLAEAPSVVEVERESVVPEQSAIADLVNLEDDESTSKLT
jgi:hypothetical protein